MPNKLGNYNTYDYLKNMPLPKIYGLIGYPVKHSLSPLMHNAAFKSLKIPAEYKLFEVEPDKLEDFLLKRVFTENIAGFNITIPHKVKAREILEKRFPFDQNAYMMQEDLYYVKLSGAINTVRREGGELKYRNTDAEGFLSSLKEDLHFNPKGKKVFLVGCGGAGRAIIAALSWKNKDIAVEKIYINDTKKEAIDSAKAYFSRFEHLKEKLEFVSSEGIPRVIKDCHLLVNASPVGMENENVFPIDRNLLHKNLSVYDLVYLKKGETTLVNEAKLRNLPAVGGKSLLLYQGARAFEFWTNKPAPVEVMREALLSAS